MSPLEHLNVAVIGVGSMGKNHARIFSGMKEVSLVGIAEPNEQIGKEVAQRYNTKWYSSYEELLEKGHPTLVSIAVPTRLHETVALASLKAGAHVFLEKPIAENKSQAESIIKLAKKKGKMLMIGHIERFNPAVQKARAVLKEGKIGEIYHIDVQRIGPFPERVTDVGVVIDLSVHDIDVISYLTGAKPKEVFAITQQRLHKTAEDGLNASITYDKNMVAVLNVNYLSPHKIRQLSIFGKKGMLRINYLSRELEFFPNLGFKGRDWESVEEGKAEKIPVEKTEPLLNELSAFIDAVKNKLASPMPGEDALHALIIAQALLESASKKSSIQLTQTKHPIDSYS